MNNIYHFVIYHFVIYHFVIYHFVIYLINCHFPAYILA